MAILGGIFGSLVDYDMGGVKSKAEVERDLLAHQRRVDMAYEGKRERQIAQDLHEWRLALGTCEANLAAVKVQRDVLIEMLKSVDPGHALIQPTGVTKKNGRPELYIDRLWSAKFSEAIKKEFGPDVDPADYSESYRKGDTF